MSSPTQGRGSGGGVRDPGALPEAAAADLAADPAAAPVTAGLGRVLVGRYAIRRLLGEGGFGTVYEAEDLRLAKPVAVKLLSPVVASLPAVVERFKREAFAASAIGHKGIVDVTDFDTDSDGTCFLVMEYLEGIVLEALIQEEGPLPPARALAIGVQAAEALDAAHRKGVLHRDLKPGNVFLTQVGHIEDFVKILDFGISKVATGKTPNLTSTGQLLGTPHYMAPEQAMGDRELDGRADIYSLGVILYEMTTKSVPFTGASHFAILHAHMHDPLTPASARCPEAAELDPLIARALAKNPQERFPSMGDFADAMAALLRRLDPETAALVRPARRRTPIVGVPIVATPLPATPGPLGSSPTMAAPPRAGIAATPVPRLRPAGRPAASPRTGGRTAEGPPEGSVPGKTPSAILAASAATLDVTPAPGLPDTTLREGLPGIEGPPGIEGRPESVAAAQPGRRRRPILLVALAGVVGALVAVLAIALGGGGDSRGTTAPATPRDAPGAARASSAPDAAPSAPAQEARVTVTLRLEPLDAQVELDGAVTDARPLTVRRASGRHRLVVRAPGYEASERELDSEHDVELHVALVRASPPGPEPGKRGPARPRTGRKPPRGFLEEDL